MSYTHHAYIRRLENARVFELGRVTFSGVQVSIAPCGSLGRERMLGHKHLLLG